MGYESKFYVVDSSRNIKDEEGYYYAEIVAMFNLCKVPNLYDKIRYYPNTNLYIYADDGNTEIKEDAYGDKLIEIPVIDMIYFLEEEMKNDNYRRDRPFLQMLKGFDLAEWHNLVVLHYGH